MMAVTTTRETTRWLSNDTLAVTGTTRITLPLPGYSPMRR
jgi:hypothetical protein